MKKITVQNLATGRSFGPMVLQDNEAEVIIAKHKGNKNTWGREERVEVMSEIPENAVSSEPRPQYMTDPETHELVLDENGLPIEDEAARMYAVTLPKEYSLSVEDVTSILAAEEMFANLRADRDAKLAATDFTQLADAPIDSATKLKYRDYRAYLRAVPNQFNDSTVHLASVETFEEYLVRISPN